MWSCLLSKYCLEAHRQIYQSHEAHFQTWFGEKPLRISPLIFISLIENAFKHGVSPTEPSFISISICGHTDGKITCEILNSNFPKNGADKSGSGIGLMQVGRRLELSYPESYEWDKGISDDGRTYISTLTIQTSEL